MSKFKVGDRVRRVYCTNNTGVCTFDVGDTGVVEDAEGINVRVDKDDHLSTGDDESRLVLAESKTVAKNIKEKFTLAFKKEPEKSFRLSGVTNGDDFLTDDGQKIFISWLLKKHGDEFKKEVVDELLKGEEK